MYASLRFLVTSYAHHIHVRFQSIEIMVYVLVSNVSIRAASVRNYRNSPWAMEILHGSRNSPQTLQLAMDLPIALLVSLLLPPLSYSAAPESHVNTLLFPKLK